MNEQEKQEMFLCRVGRKNADKLNRIWKQTYPRFCSLKDGYPRQHTKEEIFLHKALDEGLSRNEIHLFLDL